MRLAEQISIKHHRRGSSVESNRKQLINTFLRKKSELPVEINKINGNTEYDKFLYEAVNAENLIEKMDILRCSEVRRPNADTHVVRTIPYTPERKKLKTTMVFWYF